MNTIPDQTGWSELVRGRVVHFIIGALVSAGAIALVLSRTPLVEIGARLKTINLGWLAAMAAGKAAILLAKHRRWRQVLVAMACRPYRATMRAVSAGYLLNLLVPLKLGELARSAILSRHNPDVSVGDGLATVASERVMDAALLTLFTAIMLPWIVAPPWLNSSVGLFSLVLLGIIVVVVTVPLHRTWIGRLEPSSYSFLGRIHPILRSLFDMVNRGTSVWRRPSQLAAAALWTSMIWLCEAGVLLIATQSLDVSIGYPAAMVVTLLFTFGALIPSGPVQVGTHQVLAVLFLRPFGVGEATAVSTSLVLQAVNLSVLGVAGIPALIVESLARRHPTSEGTGFR